MQTQPFQGASSDRPYLVIAAMPGHKPRVVGSANNRIDGDRMVRFLQRKVATGAFYLIFEPSNTGDGSITNHS